ncbi:CHAD domain-containing protein [Poseidonocella sp. HB161398]|uniref:CHAD domain-containing protein n=1 Tax=Poseidonocella sp. HB161398 TaxID=2320855 RepID=UPI001F0DF0DB|nr:CHAD domain-containing protein [Poseidonocella sp. HB161398]
MTGDGVQVIFGQGAAQFGLAGFETAHGRMADDGEPLTGAFELYDTFDAQVAAAGRLLVSTEAGLALLGDAAARPEQPPAPPGFLDRMPEGAVTRALAGKVSRLRALMPVASGIATRRRLKLVDDEGKTLVRCELWDLAPAGGMPVSVVTLAALRGYGKALRRLLRELEALRGPGARNAAEAAALLRGEDPQAPPATRAVMAADEPALGAATGIIRAQLAIARRQEPGIIADIDSEFLHDYRVALRRTRSVVSLFKGVFSGEETAMLKARFGAVMARTGRLRDLDVYLLERETYLDLVPPSRRAGLGKLFDRFAAERDGEQAKLAAWLGSKGYAREIGRLERHFERSGRLEPGPMAERPALGYARGLIWKRYSRVCKLAQGIATCPDEQVHELRIHCKKLRYLMEFFAPLFDSREVKGLIKELKKLQDNLGLFNDYSVQQAALEEASGKVAADPGPDMVEIAAGIGALITVLNQRQQEERGRVAASFAAFDSEDTRARFRELFKPGEDRA